MFWKLLLAIGVLGLLLGLLVTGISAVLPIVTDGRTSWEEALLGIIPGALIVVISFLMFLIGLIFVIKNRKSKT